MKAQPSRPRVMVIGFDGGTWDLALPWARAGYLPTLARLMAQGSYGPLRSVLPVLSPSAWTSFATGVNPGKHGIFDFATRSAGSYRLRLATAEDIRAPLLWEILSRAGRRVATLNVPMSYPPRAVNGIMVTGLGTPENRPFTYPAELGVELKRAGYRVNKSVFYAPGREEAYLADTYQTMDALASTGMDVLRQEPWDLFALVFRDLDEISHYFWKHMDASHPQHDAARDDRYRSVILDCYRYLDEKLGELLEVAGPDVNLILLSDHGFGPLYRDVFLNEWLRQEGLLGTSATAESGAGGWFRRAGLTRQNISQALQNAGLARLERRLHHSLGRARELLPQHERVAFPDAVDWSRTRCYSYGYHGQLFINLAGREPEGVVAPGAEYERTLEDLETRLRRLTDPDDGMPVVTRLARGADLFPGPAQAAAPDLVIVMRDLAYITRHGYELTGAPGSVFVPPAGHESGSHRELGMALLCGPGFKSGSWETPCSIEDIAPTILRLLGEAPPDHMDGRVLTEWLHPGVGVVTGSGDWTPVEPAEDVGALSPEDERDLAERLRRLGYLG